MALLVPFTIAASYDSLNQCDELANQGKYIDAGLCYEQFKIWDKCTYYLLKGAREAEKEWNFNQGDWNGRVVALEYYGGAHTKACIQNYGDYELLDKVDTYHEWLTYWLTSHADPPFDMDELLADLHNKIWPPEEIPAEVVPSDETPSASAPAPTGSSENINKGMDNTVMLIAGGGILLIAILGLIVYKLSKRKPEKEEKE